MSLLKFKKIEKKLKKNIMVMSLAVFIILIANYDKSLGVITALSLGASFIGLLLILHDPSAETKRMIPIIVLGIILGVMYASEFNIISVLASIMGIVTALIYCKTSNKFLEFANA